jgi:uncharacterized protein (DUF1800 family)
MRHMLAALVLGVLAACGGGGGSSGGAGGGVGATPTPTVTPTIPPTQSEAGRLLVQASFGPTEATVSSVQSQGVSGWINGQLALPMPAQTHQAYVDARIATMGVSNVSANQFYETWFKQATTEPDQLRQRTAFALSQIFVISLNDPNVDVRGAASYYDMLERNAFGNYRKLLEDVTLHPMMGRYLTYLGNQKESTDGTRTPDENYAREVMQLMTLGLFNLNQDGTQKLTAGAATAAYTADDIKGLAKVFTGLSWYSPTPTNTTFGGGNADPNRSVTPMIFYPNFHSTSSKVFLGVTIPASTTVDMAGDLKIALDTLFNNPNVGPFIATRLIQQMVTSNPSPAYVSRVAGVFNNDGTGVRGNLAAVVKAVLTDAEARDATAATSLTFGKLREPLIRATNWMRAFNAASQSTVWTMSSTSASTSLGQSPLASPSVFNFWRPGFVPPSSTALGAANLLAPEFQTVDEVSSASWVNVIQDWITNGVGSGYSATNNGYTGPTSYTGRDIQMNYSAEIALTDNPAALIDRMNLLLFSGQMTATLQSRLVAAVTAVAIPASNGTNQAAIDTARLNRARTAIFMSLVSPEYLSQR